MNTDQNINVRRYRWLAYPTIVVLMVWMIIPLGVTIYFSFLDYNLLYPDTIGFNGVANYEFFFTDPGFIDSIINTLVLVGGVLIITISGGLTLALLVNQHFWGRGVVRLMLIAPFFIMPAVNALIWKNMFFHPVYGIFAFVSGFLGFGAIDWFADYPLTAIVIILSWQWLPFAVLIFMTALQSLDQEKLEAAMIDGAEGFRLFKDIILPHLSRSIAVVVMIETIFLLSIFAEIYITTGGGPGFDTTNLTFLIFSQALQQFDVGIASAGGLVAVVLANIVAIFFIRTVGKNFTE
ncbi:sugar ABC transporter permease [Spirochaetota bacterium]|nr:sugar ABC transporter permease [Spirochaetota bacterium]